MEGWKGGCKKYGGEGVREKRVEKKETRKNLYLPHGLWLCASESTCSLSREQSWSCLPETGGKGGAGTQGPWGKWGAGNLDT